MDNENKIYCVHCGREINTNTDTSINGYYVESEEGYICEECRNNDYTICDDCGELILTEDAYETHDGRMICVYCRDDNYRYCDDCDELYPSDELHYDDYNDRCYCPDCYENNHQNSIYSYHEFNDWEFYHTPQQQQQQPTTPLLYMGTEVEVENTQNEDNEENARYVSENINAVCMHDGSIDNGFEIVNHPQTFEYYLSRYNDYRDVFQTLIENGYRGDETTTCGLHIHVSRDFLDTPPTQPSVLNIPDTSTKPSTIDKIILFMENYKEELCNLARRSNSHWCRYLSDVITNNNSNLTSDDVNNNSDYLNAVKSIDYIKKDKERHDRYMALNLTNNNTIEFRIFKSTLNIKTYFATLQLVDSIVRVCKENTIDNIDLNKVINYYPYEKYPYLKDYVNLRGIKQTHTLENNNSLYYKMFVEPYQAKYNKILKLIPKLKNVMRKNITKMDYEHLNLINNIKSMQNKEMSILFELNCMIRDYKKGDNSSFEYYRNDIKYTLKDLLEDTIIDDDNKKILTEIKEMI